MELHAEDVFPPDNRRERTAVVSQRQRGAGRKIGGMVTVDVIVKRGPVRKERHESRMAHALLGGPNLRPSDVREREAGPEPDHPTIEDSQTGCARGFLALRKEELQPEADAEHRPARCGDRANRIGETSLREIAGTLSEVAYSGHYEPTGLAQLIWIGREPGLVAGSSEGPDHAAEIVDPVVHHSDHSTPLVDGTPWTRGSREIADSRARANALNAASTM